MSCLAYMRCKRGLGIDISDVLAWADAVGMMTENVIIRCAQDAHRASVKSLTTAIRWTYPTAYAIGYNHYMLVA